MLAFLNIVGAATVGVLIGFDKVYHFLPGFVLSNVFAHAHLAAHRLGVDDGGGHGVPAAADDLAGGDAEGTDALDQRGTPGGRRRRPVRDAARSQSVRVGVCADRGRAGSRRSSGTSSGCCVVRVRGRLACAGPIPRCCTRARHSSGWSSPSALGVWLTVAAPSSNTLRVAMAYGVFGLVGFLAQMVVGMEGRLLPIFAWYWAYAEHRTTRARCSSQHEMPWR